jgi:hypothetical protein
VYDMVRLESAGIPTAAVATEPFIDEALEQARILGMPEYRMVFIEHPVQLLSSAQLRALADGAFAEIVGRLTAPGAEREDAGQAASRSSSGRSSSA